MTTEIKSPVRTFLALLPSAQEQHRIAQRFSPKQDASEWLATRHHQQFKDKLPIEHLRGHPVAASNLHITLVFLGQTTQEQLEQSDQECQSLSGIQFSLTFDYLSYWHKPRIICLRARHMPPALSKLQSQLHNQAQNLGFHLDTRSYKPHITLLRKAGKILEPIDELGKSFNHNEVECKPITIKFNQFHLMRSTSTKKGVIYTPLFSY